MTNETETIDLLLQLFEGLDIISEQLELFECAFGEEAMPGRLSEKDEAVQKQDW
ncbi:MAG TPA: hypothetical protein VF458_23235 [Ktedonobacteraceae bacterium]